MATADLPGLGKMALGPSGKPLERMREELQILLGTRGDPLDAALTLRSAIDRGLIDRIGNAIGGATYVNVFPGYTVPAPGGGGTYEPDLASPPTVAGLTVQAGFSYIIVQFTAPTYEQGHRNLRTNIYAVKKDPSDPALPTFTAGVTPLVTAAPGALNIVSIPSELNTRWHVWAKHQTVDGVESVAVAGGVNGYNVAGAFPTTGQDITQLLTILTGQIREAQLYSTLGARIDLIDATSGTAGSVNARILTETTARGVALSALAAVKSRTFYSGTAPVSDGSYTLQTNDVWYNTADSNKPYVYSAGSWVASPDARVGQAVIDIAAETSNRTTAVAAEVSARESLYAGFGGAAGTDYKVFNQPTTPTGTTIGDVWSWKTSAGVETFKRWNGSTWVDSVSNKRPATYLGEFTNTGALPTTGTVIGDLARLTDTNTVNVWNGVSWAVKTSLPAPIFAFMEQEKRARADADSAEAGERNSLAVQLRGGYTGNDLSSVSSGLIYSERQARASAVLTQANRIDALSVSVDTPSTGLLARAASLESVTTNVTSGNIALSNRSAALESSVNTAGTGLLSRATSLESVTTHATSGNAALANRSSALESSVNTAGTGLLARATALETVTTNVTSGNTALATRASTLEARVNTPSATPGNAAYSPAYAAVVAEASARATLDGAVHALYTVRAEVSSGGRTVTGGFGLAASGTATEGPRIDFGVRADRFFVDAPAGSAVTTSVTPFVVQTTSVTVNGVTIPAGVYMDAAYINNLSAMWARFGTLIADSIAVGQISASNLTLGTGAVGGDLRSTSWIYSSDSTPGHGWLLQPNGNAFFNNAIIYGTVYASAGVFSGTVYASAGSFTGTVNATTFSGNITGATGTFSGSLNVNSGGSTRMEITSSLIRGYNSGVLRFELSV